MSKKLQNSIVKRLKHSFFEIIFFTPHMWRLSKAVLYENIGKNCYKLYFFLIFTRFVRQDMYHYYYPQENIQYFKTIKVNIGISCSGYYVFFLQKFAHKKMKTLISSFYFHIPKGRIL